MNILRYIIALLLLFGCIISMSAAAVPNVRSVVRQDGAVVESTDYYPYGTPFTTAGAVQPYKYGAKELDRMHGLDLYDSTARWYDSLTGRTSAMDPLAEKYYSLSPYTWCAGNPVKYGDERGDTIAVLHEFMHIALLVQENDKWAYYSVNGNNVYISGSVSGSSRNDSGSFCGRKKQNDAGEITFDSFEDFFYDESNTENTYKEAYIIYTSEQEDQLIAKTFKKIAKTKYSIISNNCATAVAKSLESACIKTNFPFTNTISYCPGYLFNCIILNNFDRGGYKYK